ncbi:hypothetical protein [Pseudochryseolinea flava]|uniref:Por secretion system C-terminal sorting domain-containing protein n=1 Tax=Pseudochryseolinea flava TaxID=2059302 RepID=A0A364Y1F5_9BACT|nr:hypothetical protein [Pseudochryseolinea flava]RAW00103.1 hypothetical protein DQQ10_16265 [Pseudochryseolinea flava]
MNFRITSLLFVFALLSVSAFAEAPASTKAVVSSANNSVYSVVYKSDMAGDVKVSILDKNKKLIFTETIANVASFKRPYNFSQLAEGQYTIVIEDKAGKQLEQVNYTATKVESFVRVNKVANAEGKYVLNVMSSGAEGVYVRISNASSVLHEEKIIVDKSFGLIYNLTQIKGNSEITFEVVTDSGKTTVAEF